MNLDRLFLKKKLTWLAWTAYIIYTCAQKIPADMLHSWSKLKDSKKNGIPFLIARIKCDLSFLHHRFDFDNDSRYPVFAPDPQHSLGSD